MITPLASRSGEYTNVKSIDVMKGTARKQERNLAKDHAISFQTSAPIAPMPVRDRRHERRRALVEPRERARRHEVLTSALLIAGAMTARRRRSWGIALTLTRAAWFPAAWAIGIAPAWFFWSVWRRDCRSSVSHPASVATGSTCNDHEREVALGAPGDHSHDPTGARHRARRICRRRVPRVSTSRPIARTISRSHRAAPSPSRRRG